jgi:hypothetical protein
MATNTTDKHSKEVKRGSQQVNVAAHQTKRHTAQQRTANTIHGSRRPTTAREMPRRGTTTQRRSAASPRRASQRGPSRRSASPWSLPAPPPPLLEADVRDAVRDYLRARGWTIWYFYQGPGRYDHGGKGGVRGAGAMPGIPDMCAFKAGKALSGNCQAGGQVTSWLIWIELKRPIGGRQSDDQIERQRECERGGQVYLLVRSVDDVTEWERKVGVE